MGQFDLRFQDTPMLTADQASPFGGILQKALANYRALTATQKEDTEQKYLPKEKEEALRQAMANTSILQNQATYAPQMSAAELLSKQITNQWMPKLNQSTIGLQGAEANKANTMTPIEALAGQIKNQFAPQQEQADLSQKKAMTNYYQNGGPGMGVGDKADAGFRAAIARDYPELGNDPTKIWEASNVLKSGGNRLSDGTILRSMSPNLRDSLDRVTKAGTYAGAAVPLVKAQQADAELKVLNNMSQKDFEPYATTYAGYSPGQIMDTFKRDDASQLKLGNFIASQAAQYEAAQIRNRIAGGEPGVSATQELMGKSAQIIKTRFPSLSSTARLQATKRLDEYLSEALKERNSVGVGASMTRGSNSNQSGSQNSGVNWVRKNGQLVRDN